MQPIPTETRRRILDDCDGGMSEKFAAQKRNVGLRRREGQARFLEYLKRHVLLVLKKGDVVVMDHLPAHQGDDVEILIASKGATPTLLPTYSPDLNPVETSFAKLKSLLRKENIRDVDKLKTFLRRPPKSFSKNEC